MARMVRKQIVMDPEQERQLEARARALGVSQSELVRRAIEAMLAGEVAHDRRMQAWEEFKKSAAELRAQGVGSGGQKWTREELHER